MSEVKNYLTLEDFEKFNYQKLNSNFLNQITIIKFYAPWCGYCTKTEPDYLKVYDYYKYDGDVNIMKFNCQQYENIKDIINSYQTGLQIKGYPTIAIFINSYFHNIYEGDRSTSDIIRVIENIKNSIY